MTTPPTELGSGMTVAVLTHDIDNFEGRYLLHRLCEEWQGRGAGIHVVRGAKSAPPPADLAFLHTDITVVDERYLELARHYPLVINGSVTDISKRLVSDLIIDADDDHAGPVIVKTNANLAGMREKKRAWVTGELTTPKQPRGPWASTRWLDSYPTYASKAEVPEAVWRNEHLVVEKFMPERNAQGEFVLRIWLFLGDRELHYQCISHESIIKSGTTIRREALDPSTVPERLRQRRKRLGFDYGKFDYVLVDGNAMLFDANRTPGSPPSVERGDDSRARVRRLSTGIEPFLRRAKGGGA